MRPSASAPAPFDARDGTPDLRIGIVTTSFPRHARDVSGRFVFEMAAALAGAGHQVEVLAPAPSKRLAPPCWPGITVHWVPYFWPRALQRTFYGAGVPDNLRHKPLAWLGLAPFNLALARALRRAARGWDAIISHWAVPSALCAAWAAPSLPHLAVVHSADLHLLERLPGRTFLSRSLLAQARAVSCVTASHRARLLACLDAGARETYANRCHAMPMGVFPPVAAAIDRAAARAALGLTRFTILSIARLIPLKSLDIAIRACAERSDVELVILGDGPERARLIDLTQRLGARVRFEGVCVGEAKARWLQAADVYLCTSRPSSCGRSEGMPHAVVEALVHGLPVIASRAGGLGEWLEHGSDAWLLPRVTPAAVGQALERLLGDRHLRARLAKGGQQRASAWLWPRWVERIEGWLSR